MRRAALALVATLAFIAWNISTASSNREDLAQRAREREAREMDIPRGAFPQVRRCLTKPTMAASWLAGWAWVSCLRRLCAVEGSG